MKLPIQSVIIGERQRIDLGDLHDLDTMADSDIGQIAPIIVHKTLQGYELVDGMRRLTKAKSLGWAEITCFEQDQLTEVQKQKMELLADIGRKDRSWQETCIAVAKVYRMMKREKMNDETDGDGRVVSWSIRQMARFTGYDRTHLSYMLRVAEVLNAHNVFPDVKKDDAIWACSNYTDAIKLLSDRAFADAHKELEARRQATMQQIDLAPVALSANAAAVLAKPKPNFKFVELVPGSGVMEAVYDTPAEASPQGDVSPPAITEPIALTLQLRAELFNKKYAHLGPPNTPMFYIEGNDREFIHGFWFTGGGNVSDFYGSYQVEYLERVQCMFPDFEGPQQVVHLFSGSLPPGPYTRVGIDPTGKYKSDFECDAHKLSSFLPFNPSLIYADPPYSVEDSEHYQNSMVNRAVILEQCGLVLKNGGYVIWLDQALPVFSNDNLQLVGAIGFIRSTGNRFRLVSIFRKVEKKEKEYE